MILLASVLILLVFKEKEQFAEDTEYHDGGENDGEGLAKANAIHQPRQCD